MHTETYNNISTLTIESNLDVAKVEDGLWVFSLRSSPGKVRSEGTFRMRRGNIANAIKQQGFLDDKNLELLKQGKVFKTHEFNVMPLSDQELFRTLGWQALDHMRGWCTTPFDHFSSASRIDPEEIVRADFSSHMLFDRNGEPLPVAINFDYISHGGITDGRYDLNKLAAHLLARDDVWIYPGVNSYRQGEVDRKKRATKVNECVVDIPYYNSEKGSSKTIYFRWMPTLQDYRKMWSECINSKSQYPSTRMHESIFKLDLLGFRAAGAAYYDDYHMSKRYEED